MRKWILIAALAVLLAVPVALLSVLLYTETGVEMIAAQLSGRRSNGFSHDNIEVHTLERNL